MARQQQPCQHCGKSAWYYPEPMCRACNYPAALGAPNVQIARDEKAALDGRYREACERAEQREVREALDQLERVAGQTMAVVNLPVRMAHHLMVEEKALYAPYARQVSAGIRVPACLDDDRRRRVVESTLYGKYGSEIVYGVLSTDGWGPESYGPVHVGLEEVTVSHRASVLEENSFFFVKRHGVEVGEPPPKGYLAVWEERGRLAAAKLEPSLTRDTQEEDLPGLMLSSEGDRATDVFMEVHIYGSFNWQAVGSIRAPEPDSDRLEMPEEDRILLRVAEAKAKRESLDWIRE